MSAQIHSFPREGFIISKAQCGTPGPERHLMCLAPSGHEGEHTWCDWRGCRVRLPEELGQGTVPFCGFAG